ncbi:FtsX-like permease family protein [Bacillus infantis]|uniref:FtsX-like permease family protein n=1 Tax=Bacillus infantis TaxID=324767 RepID=UPI003CE70081
MTFRQFAFKNVHRNKRLYAAYLLSSAFSVMVFFVYAVFAFHPGLKTEGIGSHVSVGLHFAEGVIYVFSFFFVLFSMSAFLKSRKKELGLLVMHGMTSMQLRKMIFLENIMIGLFSILIGIGTGLVLAKAILLAAENVLGLKEALPFYMPFEALGLTAGAFVLLFVFISIFTVSIFRGNQLAAFIKGSAAPKPEPRASRLLALLSAVLLGTGYFTALKVEGVYVSVALVPVSTVVIIGTYFLFTQLSVYIIGRLKKKHSFLFKRTNLLLFSDLAYRMKDNARTFFIVSIVSTVAFSAIGSLVGFRTVMTKAVQEENPFAFDYSSYAGNKEEAAQVGLIRTKLKEEEISYREFKAVGLYQTVGDRTAMFVKSSEYNPIARAAGGNAVDPVRDEAIKIVPRKTPAEKGKLTNLTLVESGESISAAGNTQSYAFPVYESFYVVSDNKFAALQDSANERHFYMFDVKDWKSTSDIGEELAEELPISRLGKEYSFFPLAHELDKIVQWYGAILFVGLFIGAVFFVAAGSFLYFRLFSDLDEDKKKFSRIAKIGLTDAELSKVVSVQIGLLFFVPVCVAAVHGAVALTSLQNMFGTSLIKESALVLGSFLLIQLVYYAFIRSAYLRNIKGALR